MAKKEECINRRNFMKTAGFAAAGLVAGSSDSAASSFKGQALQVWSCGGLAEAFVPANETYEKKSGASVYYTGAFAAALGKSLLGSATTEVFAPRVLGLAKKLKKQGKMLHFRPLCFAKYVLITPKGNPAGISGIEDMGKPGVKVVLSPNASPPGGGASMIILKKAGVLEKAKKNAVTMGDCVQRVVPDVVDGKGDVAVVELRLTRKEEFRDQVEVIDIPEKYIPPKPVPFVIGVMKWARNRELAEDFVNFITDERGQKHFEAAGFIPALSEDGRRLTQKLGVTDG